MIERFVIRDIQRYLSHRGWSSIRVDRTTPNNIMPELIAFRTGRVKYIKIQYKGKEITKKQHTIIAKLIDAKHKVEILSQETIKVYEMKRKPMAHTTNNERHIKDFTIS